MLTKPQEKPEPTLPNYWYRIKPPRVYANENLGGLDQAIPFPNDYCLIVLLLLSLKKLFYKRTVLSFLPIPPKLKYLIII